jgi:hypothetical protein
MWQQIVFADRAFHFHTDITADIKLANVAVCDVVCQRRRDEVERRHGANDRDWYLLEWNLTECHGDVHRLAVGQR